MKDIYQMTIAELIDSGAKIDISYFRNDEQQAESKIRPFLNLGKVEVVEYDGRKWLGIQSEKIGVTAFLNKKN